MAMERRDGCRFDAIDILDRGVDPAEIDRLPEGEVRNIALGHVFSEWAYQDAQKAGDWFGGPSADSVALFQRTILTEFFKMHGGDPFIGGRLITLARKAGFEHLEATPSYSVGLADVTTLGPGMISALGQADFRAAAVRAGVSAERFDRLADEIAIWAASDDSIAALAECTVIGWKP